MYGDSVEVRDGSEHGLPHISPLGQLKVCTKGDKIIGKESGTGREVMQGYPVSSIIFNTVVDSVVRAFLVVVYGP